MIKKSTLLIAVLLTISTSYSSFAPKQGVKKNARVLVFYKTAGFYHTSIPAGIRALQTLCLNNNLEVDTTANSGIFTSADLKKYDAVIFLNTTGDILNNAEQREFENYIRSGKGFVGVHSATDTESSWPWYNKLVGAYFADHPEIQPATIHVTKESHPSTNFLPDVWQRRDEWYNFKDIYEGINVLAELDETSYTGGKNGKNHPIAWYHNFDGGRSFYTAGGHTDESYSEPLFLRHILGGIKYAIGK